MWGWEGKGDPAWHVSQSRAHRALSGSISEDFRSSRINPGQHGSLGKVPCLEYQAEKRNPSVHPTGHPSGHGTHSSTNSRSPSRVGISIISKLKTGFLLLLFLLLSLFFGADKSLHFKPLLFSSPTSQDKGKSVFTLCFSITGKKLKQQKASKIKLCSLYMDEQT